MISYDFLWFPIRDKPGTTQGRPDKIAHLSLCMLYGFLWFVMIPNDFLRILLGSMISYDFLWFLMISMISYDSLWFRMISNNFQWFRMISYDCIRFHIMSYDFLRFPIRNNPGTTHGWPDKIAHMCLAVISYGFQWSLIFFNDSYDFLWFLFWMVRVLSTWLAQAHCTALLFSAQSPWRTSQQACCCKALPTSATKSGRRAQLGCAKAAHTACTSEGKLPQAHAASANLRSISITTTTCWSKWGPGQPTRRQAFGCTVCASRVGMRGTKIGNR